MCTITAVCHGEEDGRIEKCARQLLDVDAPGVVIDRDVGLIVTIVAVGVAERAASLLDGLDTERAVVLDTPAERVSVSVELRTSI